MTQPSTQSKVLSSPSPSQSASMSQHRDDDAADALPSDTDLLSSHFTYSFLKDIDSTGPNRPKSITIPKKVLESMGNMERQYWDIKAPHFDVVIFFKKGKFYEIYDCDAVIASREFGLKMTCDTTNRGKMRMAGVPEQSFAEWARLFVFRGYKIGRVEQMSRDEEEDGAAAAKAKVVPRELVQILTPGTLTDPQMITGSDAHFVLSFCPVVAAASGRVVVEAHAVDLSRNVFLKCPCEAPSGHGDSTESLLASVATLLHHLQPKEIVLPDAHAHSRLRQLFWSGCDATASVLAEQMAGTLHQWLTNAAHGNHTVEVVDLVALDGLIKTTRIGIAGGGGGVQSQPSGVILLGYFHFLKLGLSLLDCEPREYRAHTSGNVSDASLVSETIQNSSILTEERQSDRGVVLDAAAIDNLELVANLKDHTERHSLFAFLNRCVTNGGRRLLRQWVLRPSSSVAVIRARQAALAGIIQSGMEDGWGSLEEPEEAATSGQKRSRTPDGSFKAMFSTLFGVDFERSMSRLAELKRENVKVAYVDPLLQYNKNLSLILTTVNGFQEMALWAKEALRHLANALGAVPPLLQELLTTMASVDGAVQHILKLFDKKRAEKSGTILPSRGTMPEYDTACDELQALEGAFQDELKRVQAIFQDSSVAFCDIGKDLFLVEVPLASVKKAKVPSGDFVERTRTTKSIKYVVTKLETQVEAYKRATTAKSNALVAVLRTIADHICQHVVVFHSAFTALSYLDCLFALASLRRSTVGSSCIPVVDTTTENGAAFVSAVGVYHPLLGGSTGGSSGSSVVPNNISLSKEEGRLLVLTGPNMAGKSTLMRTVAVNLMLAQLGGYVFATNFTFSPVSRIFTRIGARDAAHRGQSTLLVELSETSDILNFADGNSLCLVDELGRGTSTHDGYAIAHATLCHLTRRQPDSDPEDGEVRASSSGSQRSSALTTAPLVMFSTHYHALALEVQNSDHHASGTQLGYMDFAITEPKGTDGTSAVKDIVFLFRLVKGICTRSYGVEVAVKAGVERTLVETAQRKSLELSQTILRHQSLQLLKDFCSLQLLDDHSGEELKTHSKEWLVRSSSLLALGAT